MYLRTLSNDELLNYAEMTTDAIVTSDLERELIRRLREKGEEQDERIAVLDDHDIDTAKELEEYIEQVGKARAALEGLA